MFYPPPPPLSGGVYVAWRTPLHRSSLSSLNAFFMPIISCTSDHIFGSRGRWPLSIARAPRAHIRERASPRAVFFFHIVANSKTTHVHSRPEHRCSEQYFLTNYIYIIYAEDINVKAQPRTWFSRGCLEDWSYARENPPPPRESFPRRVCGGSEFEDQCETPSNFTAYANTHKHTHTHERTYEHVAIFERHFYRPGEAYTNFPDQRHEITIYIEFSYRNIYI